MLAAEETVAELMMLEEDGAAEDIETDDELAAIAAATSTADEDEDEDADVMLGEMLLLTDEETADEIATAEE